MQENAKRLLKMSVDNATRENAPHGSLVKEELINMMRDDEEVDTKDLRQLIDNLSRRVAINTVANRCLASFVLADFKGRLPRAFIDSYGLKRVELTD